MQNSDGKSPCEWAVSHRDHVSSFANNGQKGTGSGKQHYYTIPNLMDYLEIKTANMFDGFKRWWGSVYVKQGVYRTNGAAVVGYSKHPLQSSLDSPESFASGIKTVL